MSAGPGSIGGSIAERVRTGLVPRATPVSEFALSLIVSIGATAAVASVLLSTPSGTRTIALPVFLLGAGLMFGLGLADLAQARERRFARVLILSGLLWSASALAGSGNPLVYSVGRVSQWFVALAIMYLLLSYPSGHLTTRADRGLVAGGALLLGLLYLPTALVAPQFPHPSLWSMCTSSCPQNVFSVVHSTPSLVRHLVVPVREALTVALFAVVAVVVIRRARQAGPLLARFYAPITAFAVLQAAIWAIYFPLRAVAPESGGLVIVSWIYALALPAVALGCGTGRLYRRFYAANALDRIARKLKDGASTAHVRRALADALEDPSLRILHPREGSGEWIDESGFPVACEYQAGQRITEIAGTTTRIAIVHDAALAEDPFLISVVGSYALAALENNRLSGELDSSLEQLAESRMDRLTTEQSARQKIERDLHDGAQQRLVALRVKLELAASELDTDDPQHARTIRALGEDVDETIDEVRAFARGIYPALLARTGLEEALRSASRDASLPTEVHADGLGRFPAETEATAYFCCTEALQNACKHARGASGVTISMWRDAQLQFEVRDDGAGFDLKTTSYGTGLTNLSDRLVATGGTLKLRSDPGHGTVLAGSIPFV
jgi:signal transduction histidine kinase